MGGSLDLSSRPGVGTQVRVRLPVVALPGTSVKQSPPAVLPAAQEALDILVVDDHPANRLLVSQQLAFLGHHCITANDGEEGFRAWRAEHFDLVMVDCNMPVMNGYELSQAIRKVEADEQLDACTVLGFTANAQPEEKQRCLQAGMNDCLFKPVSLTTLNQCLATRWPRLEHQAFSLESLRTLTGGDPKLTQRLQGELINSNRVDRQALIDLPTSAPPQAFIDIAHKIKGAARIVQATRLMESCEALEQACHTDYTQDNLQTCIDEVNHAMLELDQALLRQLAPQPCT